MAKVYKVVGYVHIKYKDKKSGNQKEADIVHTEFDSVDPLFSGVQVKEFFIPDGVTDYVPAVGDDIHISFNDRGFIEDVFLAVK